MGKCKHFYGPVRDDGYQYCEKCGEFQITTLD